METLNEKSISNFLPKRPKDANKGTFGKVLIIAGSQNYPGAAYLACSGAYRVGAGLITLVTDETTKIIIARKIPEVTFLLHDEVYGELSEYTVVLLGPGLGQESETIEFVSQLLKEKLPNTIIDADGLNILSKIRNWWKMLKTNVVLTPHPGEMARLTGLSVEKIQSDRVNVAQHFAKLWNKVVVLKGAHTAIASPQTVVTAPFANPALATAGTGDVLAGILAGFLAQGLKPLDAACVGVYIHGLAGQMLKEKIGDAGMMASDLLPLLPLTIKQLKIRV